MAFGKSLELAAIQPGPGRWLTQGKGSTLTDPRKKERKAIRAARLLKNKRHAQAKRRARRRFLESTFGSESMTIRVGEQEFSTR